MTVSVEFPPNPDNEIYAGEMMLKASSVRFKYSILHVRSCIRGLVKADLTNLRINREGMISMQHIIPSGDGKISNWVDFMILPLENSGEILEEKTNDQEVDENQSGEQVHPQEQPLHAEHEHYHQNSQYEHQAHQYEEHHAYQGTHY